jgi:hypothetical protein
MSFFKQRAWQTICMYVGIATASDFPKNAAASEAYPV